MKFYNRNVVMATMDWCLQTTLVLLVAVSSGYGSVLQFSVKDVFVELTAWGMVTMGRYNLNSTSPHSRDVEGSMTTIDVKEIKLLDSSHNTVRRFNLRESKERLFEITEWQASDYWNIGASGRSMKANGIEGLDGDIAFKAYIFTEDGRATIGTSTHMVKLGDARVDIELKDVTACSTCHNVAFIEVVLGIKGDNNIPENVHMYQGKTRIEVPGSTILYVNEEVTLDGHVVKMVDGFPEVESEPSHVEVIARFPRFTKSVSYGFYIKPDKRDPADLRLKMPTRADDLMKYTTARTEQVMDRDKKGVNNDDPHSHGKPAAAVDTSGQIIIHSPSQWHIAFFTLFSLLFVFNCMR